MIFLLFVILAIIIVINKNNFYVRHSMNLVKQLNVLNIGYLDSFDIKTTDNEQINIQYHIPKSFSKVILFIPGFNADIKSEPIHTLCYQLKDKYAVYFKNWRGYNNNIKKTPEHIFTNQGLSDLHLTIANIKQRHREDIILIGHSLGGNISIKYNSIYNDPRIIKMVAICSPINLYKSYIKFKDSIIYKKFSKEYINNIRKRSKNEELIKITNTHSGQDAMSKIVTDALIIDNYETWFKSGTINNEILRELDKPLLWVISKNDKISYYDGIEDDLYMDSPFFYKLVYNYGEHGNYVNSFFEDQYSLSSKLDLFINN